MGFFDTNGKDRAKEKYTKWWVGKYCRMAGGYDEFKKVTRIELIGPPSFIHGQVTLYFEDGTAKRINTMSYTPRKQDVEIKPKENG